MKHLMLLSVLVALLAMSGLRCYTMEPIYDTDGKELRAGVQYYILAANRSLGGGLDTDAMDGDVQCPQRVRFSDNAQYEGFPVLIAPWEILGASADDTLILSVDVEIRFNYTKTACAELKWYLHTQDGDMQGHVAAGESDGSEPLSSVVFRIERYDGAPKRYKLVSCGGWPDDGRQCHDLGLYLGRRGMKKWLVVSADKPYVVVFKKLTSQSV